MSPLKISIPEPCTQNWADLSPAEQGRYCSSCQKEVIDFRGWTADELQDWFAKSKGRVCGRLSQRQLAYFKPEETQSSGRGFHSKMLLASALALLVGLKAYAGTNTSAKVAIYEDKNRKKAETKQKEQVSDSLITISGVVKDENDKLPIPGVIITIKNRELQMITGGDGKFQLQFNARKGEHLRLTARLIGYNSLEREITVGEKDQIEVIMSVDNASLMGDIMVIRPSFPKRLWNFIKRPFVKHP